MIVLILKNPDPKDLLRVRMDIEVRLLVEGATDDEGERLGDALRDMVENLRPGTDLHAFRLDSSKVVV